MWDMERFGAENESLDDADWREIVCWLESWVVQWLNVLGFLEIEDWFINYVKF